MKKIYCLAVFFLITSMHKIDAQDENKPWERLGLSQTEWKMILDNKMPMSKVEQLLKCGIGIGEYFRKPWESVHLSEEKWIKKRRSGLTNYDIELEASSRDNSRNNENLKNVAIETAPQKSQNAELFASLFLPGHNQWQSQQKVKSTFMFSIAAGSVIWCTIGSIVNKRFEVIPIGFVLVPDMLWSLIDCKVKKRNDLKKQQGKI